MASLSQGLRVAKAGGCNSRWTFQPVTIFIPHVLPVYSWPLTMMVLWVVDHASAITCDRIVIHHYKFQQRQRHRSPAWRLPQIRLPSLYFPSSEPRIPTRWLRSNGVTTAGDQPSPPRPEQNSRASESLIWGIELFQHCTSVTRQKYTAKMRSLFLVKQISLREFKWSWSTSFNELEIDSFHYLQFKEPKPTIPGLHTPDQVQWEATLQNPHYSHHSHHSHHFLRQLYFRCSHWRQLTPTWDVLGSFLSHYSPGGIDYQPPYSINFLESSSKIFVKLCNAISFLRHHIVSKSMPNHSIHY
jgi:hypothetical protein